MQGEHSGAFVAANEPDHTLRRWWSRRPELKHREVTEEGHAHRHVGPGLASRSLLRSAEAQRKCTLRSETPFCRTEAPAVDGRNERRNFST